MKISFIMDLRDNIAVRMEQAHKLLEEIYSHRDKIIGLLVNETATELLFTALVTGRTDLAKTLYTPDLKKYIDNYKGVMSSKVRTLWAIALFMENNKEEADNIYRTLLERKEDYLMQGEVKMDISLIERISSNQQKS